MGTRTSGTISSSVTSAPVVCRLPAPLTEKQPMLFRLKNKQIKYVNSIYKILNRFAYFSVSTQSSLILRIVFTEVPVMEATLRSEIPFLSRPISF